MGSLDRAVAFLAERFGGFDVELEDRGGLGITALADATRQFLAAARRQPAIDPHTLITSFGSETPEYDFNLDRNKAKLLGLNLSDVFDTMQAELGSLYVNNVTLFGHTFRVEIQARDSARARPSDLSGLYVRNAANQMVTLSAIGRLAPTVGPVAVTHYNLYNAAEITGSPAPGYSSSQAIAAMERVARTLPSDFGYEWTGITYQELKAGSAASTVFVLAIAFVFLFLAAQYESWSIPFVIILTVPLALFGALGLLWLRSMTVDVYAQIGFVLLIGLAAIIAAIAMHAGAGEPVALLAGIAIMVLAGLAMRAAWSGRTACIVAPEPEPMMPEPTACEQVAAAGGV